MDVFGKAASGRGRSGPRFSGASLRRQALGFVMNESGATRQIVDPAETIRPDQIIPGLSDQNRCAQSRNPRDIMRQG